MLRIVPETLPVRQDIISKPHDIHPQPQGERVMTFTKSRVIDCIVRTYRAALACPARTGEHRRHQRSDPVDAGATPAPNCRCGGRQAQVRYANSGQVGFPADEKRGAAAACSVSFAGADVWVARTYARRTYF